MKVQLIVVQGKPEGKVIPLAGPTFKIGRGETCHLRPNSELVSREHAEFSIAGDQVTVIDLGSRNGTLVNGKAISGACTLRDQDLVTVGHLTFAMSIQGVPAVAKPATPSPAGKKAAPEDVSHDDIESWLVADSKNKAPERPSGVYGGDTITISAFKDATAAKPAPAKAASAPTPEPAPAKAAAPAPATTRPSTPAPVSAPPASTLADDDSEYERLPEGDGDRSGAEDDALDSENDEEGDEDSSTEEAAPEEFIDESNPFYVPKKKAADAAQPTKTQYKDTSDAASDILRKMMERRRGGGS